MKAAPTSSPLWLALAALAVLLGGASCERPPVTPSGDGDDDDDNGDGDGDGDGDGRVDSVAISGFQQDYFSMGTKWYAYEPGAHVLTPYEEAYLVRDGDASPVRYAAFRVKSYYDENSAESGLFTLGLSYWEGGAWTPEEEWVTPRNVKNTGPLCVDIFAQSEKGCGAEGWHLSLRNVQYMAIFSNLVVNNAGVFFRSAAGTDAYGEVWSAWVADRPTLTNLPDPTAVEDLAAGPPVDWLGTEWDFARFAPNLPEQGMVLGTRYVDEGFVGRDDVYFLVNSKFTIVKLQVKPTVDGDPSAGLTLTYGKAPLDIEDVSYDQATINSFTTVQIDRPALGDVRFLSFENDDLSPKPPILDPDTVTNAIWPWRPPNERAWDLAIEAIDDDSIRILVSPGGALAPVTQYELAEGLPVSSLEDALPPRF